MKDDKGIQLRQALMMLAKLQNEVTFYKSKLLDCVSIEEYEVAVAECEGLRSLCGKLVEKEQVAGKERDGLKARLADTEARLEESESARKKTEAENKDLRRQISDLEDTNALLTADKFGPSSEVMDRLFGKHTPIPKEKVDFLAMLSRKGYDCDKALKSLADAANEDTAPAKTKDEEPAKRRKSRGKDKRPRAVWVDRDSIVFPVDDSDLPKNARMVAREDGGVWTFRLLYVRRMKLYSAAYRMARYNVPGEGQRSSRHPDTLFEGCHLTPSFIGAYHRFKFQYNVSEQNFLRLLKECGCEMRQSSLNQMIHADMTFIRGKLEEPMLEEIKASPFTHNDETMLSVKFKDSGTGGAGYHDGCVHGILSPSARLIWMTYEEGSRKHDIQESVLKDSRIRCFTSDKAKMYRKIIKDIGEGKITVGYCWGHGRRELYKGYQVDRRLRPLIELIGYLFDIEQQCGEEKLDADQRRQRRQDFSRPVVDMIFSRLKAIVARPDDFGKRVTDACNYFLNDEDGFRAFLDNGLIELHNNPIEACFRHIAVGRGTWQHCGGHKGAENIAFIYGLEQSCRLNGIDYGNYIEYVHERLMSGETDMHSLLPNHIRIPADWIPEGERFAREIEAVHAS